MNIEDASLKAAVAEAVQRAMEPYDRQLRQVQDSSIRVAENIKIDAERVAQIAKEDRDRLAITVREDAERLAEDVAIKAVKSLMLGLGLDPDKPRDFIQDMMFLQELRKTFSAAKTHAITVLVGIIMLGLATGAWQMLKGGKP